MSILLPGLALAACVVSAFASSGGADDLWAQARSAQKIELPRFELSEEYIRAYEKRSHAIADSLAAFIAAHPNDPRRADAIIELARARPMYVRNIGNLATDGWGAIVHDSEVEAGWKRRIDAWLEEVRVSPGTPEKVRESAYEEWVASATAAAVSKQMLSELRHRLDELRARYPQNRAIQMRSYQYVRGLRNVEPSAVRPWLEQIANSPQADVSNWAKGELAVESWRDTPIDLAFTAIDGTAVDFAQLRGKVVLLDFWATWCGPCKAEIPNVKAAYEEFRSKGFEVVAVSLDRENDRQKLLDYVKEHDLRWPQHFVLNEEGRNVLAQQYGVTAIPAAFLFDKTGRLVTTDARGKKLHTEIQRLLAQSE